MVVSELYSAAFVEHQSRAVDGAAVPLSVPGLRGVVGGRDVRLLVSDDRSYDRFAAAVAAAGRGFANVFERAARCGELLRGRPGWTADRPSSAMVLRDLHAVPDVELPDNLALRPVSMGAASPGSVALEDAVAVAIASDPGITDPAAGFAAFLRGLPPSVRLFTAVDEDGVVRATCGCDVAGSHARIFFVNTEPGRRRRGIGRAMTAAALRESASSGARHAFLHATADGASVYASLGFEPVGQLTRYSLAV